MASDGTGVVSAVVDVVVDTVGSFGSDSGVLAGAR